MQIDQESKVEQDAEDAGFIKVGMLPLDDLMGSLERLEAEGFAIWVGLYSIAQTLKLQSILKGAT